MPSHEINYFSPETYALTQESQAGNEDTLLIILDKDEGFDLSTYLQENPELNSVLGMDEVQRQYLLDVSSTLSVSPDSFVSTQWLVPKSVNTEGASTKRFQKVVLSYLPDKSKVSRHNTPSRSHSVAQIVQSVGATGGILVLLLTSSPDYIFPQAVSVSRAFPTYSRKSKLASSSKPVNVVVKCTCSSPVEDLPGRLRDVANVAAGIRLTQDLVDSPPNELHTDAYVQICRDVASRLGCEIRVISGRELETQGFGGLWGVGKASEHLPALVVLSHVPSGDDVDAAASRPSVCLVGKGIVYDTGGLSIKDRAGMVGMKTDMGGSAGVLGAFNALVSSGCGHPVHALLCISENSVGPLATRPDDVHTMLSGKTVEINNTDAEGRLVLADGVFFAARELNPFCIVDMATLTGAQLIATGRRHAAICSSEESLERLAVEAGRKSGDLTFPIPYCPEFFKQEFASKVADMKNSVKDRSNAQASCAAQFIANHIEEYISKGGAWLHIDMAGPVESGERATGYGVSLLFTLVRSLSPDAVLE